MNYNIDFVGYEYQVNCEVNHRFGVFIHQILPDIYIYVNDHQTKMMSIKYITKTILKFMKMNLILTHNDDELIINEIKKIADKPVWNEYSKVNKIRYIGD